MCMSVSMYTSARKHTHTHTYKCADMIEREREHCFWKASDSVHYCIDCDTVQKENCTQRGCHVRCQPSNFENATVVAPRREHFRSFCAICVVDLFSLKRCVFIHTHVQKMMPTPPQKLENELEASNKQRNVIDLTMQTLATKTKTDRQTDNQTRCACVCVCVRVCVFVCVCVCLCQRE